MTEEAWDNWDTPAGIQCVPRDDIIDHIMGGVNCICDPKVEDVGRKHVSNMQISRKLIIHNLWDKKEEGNV